MDSQIAKRAFSTAVARYLKRNPPSGDFDATILKDFILNSFENELREYKYVVDTRRTDASYVDITLAAARASTQAWNLSKDSQSGSYTIDEDRLVKYTFRAIPDPVLDKEEDDLTDPKNAGEDDKRNKKSTSSRPPSERGAIPQNRAPNRTWTQGDLDLLLRLRLKRVSYRDIHREYFPSSTTKALQMKVAHSKYRTEYLRREMMMEVKDKTN